MMHKTLVAFTLVLLAGAAVAQDKPKAKKTPAPKPAAKGKAVAAPRISGVSPLEAPAGSALTISGTGFDQGGTILLGSYAPSVVETADDRIVVKVPENPQLVGSSLEIFVVTPGNPVTPSGFRVLVLPS